MAVFASVDGQGCSNIQLYTFSKKSNSQATQPTLQTPTVTQEQCTANKQATVNSQTLAVNSGINFLCGGFKNPDLTLTLAPNMRYFLLTGLNPSLSTQFMESHASGLYPSEAMNQDLLDSYDKSMTTASATITYRQTLGATNILTPVRSGVVFSVVTPSEEGSYEYQVQGQNKYGVSPVKTIHIDIKKAGMDPVDSPKCPGFDNTVVMDLNRFYGARMLSKQYGKFGPKSALVIKFTLSQIESLNIGDLGNGWTFSTKTANISSRPCDFETNENTFYRYSNYPDQLFPPGGQTFDQAMVITGNTFYINIENMSDARGCGPMGYTDCAQFIEYGFEQTTPQQTAETIQTHMDWGPPEDCPCGPACTTTYGWSNAINAYDYSKMLSCVATTYISPYYQ